MQPHTGKVHVNVDVLVNVYNNKKNGGQGDPKVVHGILTVQQVNIDVQKIYLEGYIDKKYILII